MDSPAACPPPLPPPHAPHQEPQGAAEPRDSTAPPRDASPAIAPEPAHPAFAESGERLQSTLGASGCPGSPAHGAYTLAVSAAVSLVLLINGI